MYTKEVNFVETALAGTYTGTIEVPAGTRLIDALWKTTADFAAATAALSVGRTGALTDFFNAVDVKSIAAGALTLGESLGKIGYQFGVKDTITVKVVTTGAGGTTGRCSVLLMLARPISAITATKV